MSRIENNRVKIENDLARSGQWKYFSPILYTQYKTTLPLILKNVTGKLLDVGCGRMPFRDEIMRVCETYDGLDIQPVTDAVKYVCDAHEMGIIPDHSYDSVICLEVLEHVQDPRQVLSEINRVLRPQGTLVVSIPHLSRLHSIPHDYYRYTRFGIAHLLEKAGFSVVEIKTRGGLLTFIGHQLSTALLGIFWGIPVLGKLVYLLNKWLVIYPCFYLDRWIDTQGIFACGYAVLARKK